MRDRPLDGRLTIYLSSARSPTGYFLLFWSDRSTRRPDDVRTPVWMKTRDGKRYLLSALDARIMDDPYMNRVAWGTNWIGHILPFCAN